MNTAEIVTGLVGVGGLGGIVGALIGRPKVRAEARRIDVESEAQLSRAAVETVEGLMGPLREEVAHLSSEVGAARQTIATQQQTIAEQQRTIALQNTQLAETRSEMTVLNRAFLALQDWVRDNGGDPQKILAAAGHPPGPAGFPLT